MLKMTVALLLNYNNLMNDIKMTQILQSPLKTTVIRFISYINLSKSLFSTLKCL